jgi:WbqC-like protein family
VHHELHPCSTTDRLVDVAEASTRLLLQTVGWQGHVLRSSELPARTGRSERLADLTVAAKGTEYLCGTGGRRYLSLEPFDERGVAVRWFQAPAQCDAQFDLWPSARQVSALWALMTIGADVLRNELVVTQKAYR